MMRHRADVDDDQANIAADSAKRLRSESNRDAGSHERDGAEGALSCSAYDNMGLPLAPMLTSQSAGRSPRYINRHVSALPTPM